MSGARRSTSSTTTTARAGVARGAARRARPRRRRLRLGGGLPRPFRRRPAPPASSSTCACPGMDGLTLLETLGARRQGVPVVMMTAHGDVPMAARAMRAGAADFVEKPFEAEALLASLAGAMAAHRTGRRRRPRAPPPLRGADAARARGDGAHGRGAAEQAHRPRPRHEPADRRDPPRPGDAEDRRRQPRRSSSASRSAPAAFPARTGKGDCGLASPAGARRMGAKRPQRNRVRRMTDRDAFLVRVIDDDAAVRESLEALLAVAGHPVASFGSAEEYLAAADADRRRRSGCILLDLHMPGMGGFGLMGALSGRADAPPVVVLTAARERALHERAHGPRRAGGADEAGDHGDAARDPRRPRRGAGVGVFPDCKSGGLLRS